MKKINFKFLFIAGILFTSPSFAHEEFDLKCTLDDGVQMTVSHVSEMVYIDFLAPESDPDEGGSVIKLSIPSGEVKQSVWYDDGQITFFGIRGNSPDDDSTIVVSYYQDMKTFIGNKKTKLVYSDVMTFLIQDNNTGETIENKCVTDTIKVGDTLTENGISGVINIE